MPLNESVNLRDLRDVLRAQMALLGAQAYMRVAPSGRMLCTAGHDGAALPDDTGTRRAVELARAIDRASRRGLFRPRCLARSLALEQLLHDEGIGGAQIHVGVRHAAGTFEAHAWVTLRGRVLGDDPAHVGRYREIGEIRLREFR